MLADSLQQLWMVLILAQLVLSCSVQQASKYNCMEITDESTHYLKCNSNNESIDVYLNTSCTTCQLPCSKEDNTLLREFTTTCTVICTTESCYTSIQQAEAVKIAACPERPGNSTAETAIPENKSTGTESSRPSTTQELTSGSNNQTGSKTDAPTDTTASTVPTSSSLHTSTILAIALSIVILALVATVVVALLMYWRFRLKISRERSYHVNSGPAGDIACYPPADPLYSEIVGGSSNVPLPNLKLCGNYEEPHLPSREIHLEPHLAGSHRRPPLEQPGYSKIGCTGNDITARDYEEPTHSIQQMVSLELLSHDKMRDSEKKGEDTNLGSKEMGSHNPDTGDTADTVDANTILNQEGTSPVSEIDTTNTYDRIERVDTNMTSNKGQGGISPVSEKDTTNTYDRMEQTKSHKGDTTHSYDDTVETVDANTANPSAQNNANSVARGDIQETLSYQPDCNMLNDEL